MKYLITISYDGSKFYGFQKQNDKKTIQGELEKVLGIISRTNISVKGSGRTDRGVHAINQKCHFYFPFEIKTQKLMQAINDRIDSSIYVKSCEKIDDDFHARFSVKKKSYYYIINLGEKDPLINDYVYNLNQELNINEMKRAAKHFLGYHSFQNFVSGKRDNYDSVIEKIKFKKIKHYLYIEIIGKSFYKYMVRNIIGSLIYVGLNKITVSKIFELINSENILIPYATAPASGLYLNYIEY